jgi:twitching motility protein PilJ
MLKNMRIRHKAVLVAVAFSVPIIVLLQLLVTEQAKAISFAQKERAGVEYLAPASALFRELQLSRDLSAASLGGDASFKDRALAKRADVDQAFVAMEAAERRFGAALGTGSALEALKRGWQDLRGKALELPPVESFDRHGRLIYATIQLVVRAGNASNLVLDPDVDSYYAMDAVIFKLPKLLEDMSQARGLGARILARPREIALEDKAWLASLRVRIEGSRSEMSDNLQFGLEVNPRMAATLRPAIEYSDAATTDFLEQLNRKILGAAPEVTAGDYYDTATQAMDVSFKLVSSAAATLDDLLEARIARLNRQRALSLAAVGLSLGVALLLLVLIVRSITVPIRKLCAAADRISLGDMSVQIEINTQDDIGELAQKFRRLQVSLKASMDELEAREEDRRGDEG